MEHLYEGILTVVLIVLWFLLRQKDEGQQKDIANLYKKHDDDVKALTELRIEIAAQHYKKAELDMRFERLEKAFHDGFKELGDKFDKLSSALMKHMDKE